MARPTNGVLWTARSAILSCPDIADQVGLRMAGIDARGQALA